MAPPVASTTGFSIAGVVSTSRNSGVLTVPTTAKAVRDSSRVFFASASDEVPDKQGRITVPAALRTYAGLDRDCVVIGANTRLEIWDAQAWETYLAAQEDSFSEAAEEVLPGIL